MNLKLRMTFKSNLKSLLLQLFKMTNETVAIESDLLNPPSVVRGMTKWQPELFEKTVILPHVELPVHNISIKKAGKILKPLKLKIPNFLQVQDASEKTKKIVVLDPSTLKTISDEDKSILIDKFECSFGEKSYKLDHTNFHTSKCLEAILPKGAESLTSSTIVGHITYVNLRDHLFPFKEVIGQLVLNSNKHAKLVVTKTNIIENKFRNLDLEILAGDPSFGFEVTVKENGCTFNLDFSKVYWNPRLSTEHQRIVDMVNCGDTVFDVFAGVGPFAVPIGVKGKITKKQTIPIKVFANDLNPNSYEYLKKNLVLNKVDPKNFHCSNLDGNEFIRSAIKSGLKDYFESDDTNQVHIIMNLPALATTFLSSFRGLITSEQYIKWKKLKDKKEPLVNVYAFTSDDDKSADLIKECCAQLKVESIKGIQCNFVRDVAPKKDMYRVTFPLSLELLSEITENHDNGHVSKRPKLIE